MKILLIDDDKIFLETVAYYLKKHYEVLTASNGKDGLRLIRETESIDCLVVDYMMPCISGLDIAKIVHSTPELKDIPIVMMTNFNYDEEFINSAREFGIKLFITKDLENLIRLNLIINDAKNIKDLQNIVDRIKE